MMHREDIVDIALNIGIVFKVVVRSGLSFVPEVGVSFARGITHLAHKGGQLCAERSTGTF